MSKMKNIKKAHETAEARMAINQIKAALDGVIEDEFSGAVDVG